MTGQKWFSFSWWYSQKRVSTTTLTHRKLFYIRKIKKQTKKVTKNVIWYFQRLRGHKKDYANTLGKLWRLLTDFEGTIRYLGVFTHANSNNLKIWKCPYLTNICVSTLSLITDTGYSNFAIEYLRENEKVRETVFACSYWA